MNIPVRAPARALVLIGMLSALLAGPSSAADAAPPPGELNKDLTAVIMLLGLPCGHVVSAKRQSDNDHVAMCKNGNRYRVYVNAEGRVVAQKQ